MVVSNIFHFHPENWGRWTHFDEQIFQMGWSNHQPGMDLLNRMTLQKIWFIWYRYTRAILTMADQNVMSEILPPRTMNVGARFLGCPSLITHHHVFHDMKPRMMGPKCSSVQDGYQTKGFQLNMFEGLRLLQRSSIFDHHSTTRPGIMF